MNQLNKRDEQNEPIMNEIEVRTTVFKKIYRFTEFHYENISKSFIYITIEVEIYENENENENEYEYEYEYENYDYDNNSICTNTSIDTDARSVYLQDVNIHILNGVDMNGVDMNGDAYSVNTTDSHSIASKNRKNSKKGKKKKIIKIPSQEQEHLNKYNHDSSDCNHDPNNPIKPKPLLNINKIKNIVSNDKKDARKKVKIVPIEKKINTIMEKITSKLQSEIMKEYMNYNLILENSKKSKKQNGSYINHIKAIYHVLLNKIDSKL